MADYNQIELRCIAHLAEDPGLISSFESGRDIHTETAARVFGVEPGAVTIEQLRGRTGFVVAAAGAEDASAELQVNLP